MSARKQTNLTEVFHDFPQSIQVNASMVAQNSPLLLFDMPIPIYHPHIILIFNTT